MTPKRASVKDVAALAGVSVGTVSNVLNRPDSVAGKTRIKVEQAMAELNFHRNASARQLRAGVSRTVGAIVMDVGNPYYTELARGIEDRLADDDHTLILCSSDDDPRREARFLRLLAEQGVRGVLVTPMSTTKDRLAALRRLGIPSVLMDSSSQEHAAVGVDHVSGGRQAIAHLLARGHRRILVLAGPEELQQSRHRLKGAIQAIQAVGLEVSDVLQVVTLPALTANDGQQGMAEGLDGGWGPSAVFCMNDLVALGAMRELRRRGLAVPTDMAVVGYDDLYLAAELMTPLTSVRQPMRQLGWAAAELLLTQTPHEPFKPELIIRASSDYQRVPWWRGAVVYQIYPRSFADSNNDGTGDIRGMIDKLDYLKTLGINAVWVSPWYRSPMADGGYDVSDYCDIDPAFGTLADADEFLAKAHGKDLRVLIDLVPNHCSLEHPSFQAALAAGPGSPERELFHFRDGRGPDGSAPPNNWGSLFGGSAWQRVVGADGPEQYYLHMFAPEQPDWNWGNPKVAEVFDAVIRFWFDRGVDGLRVDVADGLAKQEGLPDARPDPATGFGTAYSYPGSPLWNQPELDAIQRHWRAIAEDYSDRHLGERIFVCEANVRELDALMRFVDAGRMHTTFNFDALLCEWTAASLRAVIDRNLIAHASVGAPTTWVLGNHDTTRVATRYGKPATGRPFTLDGGAPEWTARFGDYFYPMPTDIELGRRRARAAALLELALPGPAYIYQGEELGLPEVEDLPDGARQDPTYFRTGGRIKGRDGCRVPLPWSGTAAPYGFGVDAAPWLPQPAAWAELSVAAQDTTPDSTLNLYRRALAIRAEHPGLGDGTIAWNEDHPSEVLFFTREPGFGCLVNLGGVPVPLPGGARLLLSSSPLADSLVLPDTAVWLTLDSGGQVAGAPGEAGTQRGES